MKRRAARSRWGGAWVGGALTALVLGAALGGSRPAAAIEPSASASASSAPVDDRELSPDEVAASSQQRHPLRPWEWPPGRTITVAPGVQRPSFQLPQKICSFDLPVCVHWEGVGAKGGASMPRNPKVLSLDSAWLWRRAQRALGEAEAALRYLHRAGLPLPEPDGFGPGAAGGSGAFDLYFDPDMSADGQSSHRIGIEPASSIPRDRAAAFGLLAGDLAVDDSCAGRSALARLVALAQLVAVDAGESPGTLASFAQLLTWDVTGCVPFAAIDDAQRFPERPMMPVTEPDDPAASPLLPYYLDQGFGAGLPGALAIDLFRASGQRTPPLALRYTNLDFFVTLAQLARGSKKTMADLLSDAAVARAFLGDREDGLHLPASAVFGTFGRPRFEAAWDYQTLPKRLSFTPLAPTGSSYTWIDVAGAPKGAGVIVSIAWELPITIRWAVLRVGHDGQELSRVDITREPGVFEVQRTILELDDTAGLLLVGVSVGEVGPRDPFRSDEAPYEPHGGTIYVLRQSDLPP
jgi:hypothetical protein